MDAAVTSVFGEYDARSAREAALFREARGDFSKIRRDDLLLSVGPATGRFMNTLIKGARAQRIVEIGTSYGYSTIWLAEAARETGGRVYSLEIAPEKQRYAREMLEKAGLAAAVELRCGNALELIPELEPEIDFVLLDLWKDLYVPCLERIVPKLAGGSIIVADNMLQPRDARDHARAYRHAVRALPGVSSVLLPIGSGLEVSRLPGKED
jgi:predicted O-methyltransferase YrrM